MRGGLIAVLVAVALVGAACGDDDDGDAAPTSGPVTIEVQIDFTPDLAEGPFEVTEGADVLGCTDGTSVDEGSSEGITKVFTCESGPSAGTFSMLFRPEPDTAGPADESGPWTVSTGTEDFAGLQGQGVMTLTLDSDTTGVATFTGTVESGA